MTITEQKLEGEFRYINSRLISNSEEVAFYNGNHREKLILIASFEKLVSFEHFRYRYSFHVLYFQNFSVTECVSSSKMSLTAKSLSFENPKKEKKLLSGLCKYLETLNLNHKYIILWS